MGAFLLLVLIVHYQYMKQKGFTLTEVLVVVGIIVLLLSVVLVSIRASKNKAADAEIKKTIAEIAVKAESKEIAPGVMDYQSAFTSTGVTSALTQLAAKNAVNQGAGLGSFDYSVSATSYAILFPLKKGGYYCVDSYGNATAKEVTGQFQTTGAKTCATATRTTPPTNNVPVLTLNAPTVVGDGVYSGFFTHNGASVFGILPEYWTEPSYTATDVEDGNITSSVVIAFPDGYGFGFGSKPSDRIFASVKKLIEPAVAEAKGESCLGSSQRHYYVTDSAGNTVHAYRDFIAVC